MPRHDRRDADADKPTERAVRAFLGPGGKAAESVGCLLVHGLLPVPALQPWWSMMTTADIAARVRQLCELALGLSRELGR
jgi:hypothetical protein